MVARGSLARFPPASALRAKAGFTLLEMLLVLAIMGLTAAIVMPRIGRGLDQALANTEFFKFQQQVLDLRRQTFHDEQSVKVVDSGQFTDDAGADPPVAEVQLGSGWSYRLSDPLVIDAGGVCSPVNVELLREGRSVMRLEGLPSCRFLRVV